MDKKIPGSMYSDDLVVLANSDEKFQQYCNKIKLTVNVGKTKIIFHSKINKNISAGTVDL